jgi:hypothetical protein
MSTELSGASCLSPASLRRVMCWITVLEATGRIAVGAANASQGAAQESSTVRAVENAVCGVFF